MNSSSFHHMLALLTLKEACPFSMSKTEHLGPWHLHEAAMLKRQIPQGSVSLPWAGLVYFSQPCLSARAEPDLFSQTSASVFRSDLTNLSANTFFFLHRKLVERCQPLKSILSSALCRAYYPGRGALHKLKPCNQFNTPGNCANRALQGTRSLKPREAQMQHPGRRQGQARPGSGNILYMIIRGLAGRLSTGGSELLIHTLGGDPQHPPDVLNSQEAPAIHPSA